MIQLCYLDQICISCHTGRHKGAEACYLDGRSCHCHIWDLLGYCLSCLRHTLHNILQHWFRPICLCQHNDPVQFNCQPVRLRLVKSTVQREIEGNDILHLFRTTQEPQGIEPVNDTTHPTHPTHIIGPSIKDQDLFCCGDKSR